MQWIRRYLPHITLVFVLLIALFCFFTVCKHNNQSIMPKPMPLAFSGEYSSDGIHWAPLTDGAGPGFSGDTLYLRGRFSSDIPDGQIIHYYRNHVGISIYLNGTLMAMDTVSQMHELGLPLMDSMCGRQWAQLRSPGICTEDLVEIRLLNPHGFGGKTACEEFLLTLCVSGDVPELLQENLSPYGKHLRSIGQIMTVVAVMLFGAAIAAGILRIPVAGALMLRSALVLFAGGIFYYDAIDSSFLNPLLVANTYGWQLCLMLYGLCLCWIIPESLTGGCRRVGMIALPIGTAAMGLLFLVSLSPGVTLYDMLPLWAPVQGVLYIILTGCSLYHAVRIHRKAWLLPASVTAAFAAFVPDLFGLGSSILSRFTCTKAVFLLLLFLHLLSASARIVRDYSASQRVKKLEKELEASRIAVMLSQIRPHFLFNSLGAIQELCHSEPAAAESAIEKFALYLRGNMSALSVDKLIPFPEEMKHVRSYLDLEQLRFGDQLEVQLDITATGFHLPVLTVQPLVENAVRHGVRKNENGGWVRLSTREYPDRWTITVEDNGPGFRPESSTPGETHLGLQNVRLRLQEMCQGSLEIKSAPGAGTCVTVTIPKENA